VLSNLIKNALIHSGGTELEVGASGSLLEGERKALRLWIADNGKGVSADKVEQLFEAFVRGSTEAEGTGLGLHICREIIQNMGGELRYEPRPEGGACFVIELEVDLAKADPSEQLKPQANESSLKGMRVLLAEDNKMIQMLTQKMLSKQGAQVTIGNNGKEALEVFESGKFDLVLSDIFMPEMNGYEFAREVRRVDTKVPLIGLTAATIGKETDDMLAAGASAVLSKPITLSKLSAKLAELVALSNPV
jgi:CheY-like chemotaxis protein